MSEPQIIKNADSYDLDTREQLETDILAHYKTPEEKLLTVRKWLDRQAAITERECMTAAGIAATEAPALQAKVDSLTAERDKLKAEIEKYEHDCELLFDEKRNLTAERDELREALEAYELGQMYELWRRDHARLEAITAALHDKPGT